MALKYLCPDCKSDLIIGTAWYYINTFDSCDNTAELNGEEGPFDNYRCANPDCANCGDDEGMRWSELIEEVVPDETDH